MPDKIKSPIYPYHWDVIGTDSLPHATVDPMYLEYRKKWEMNPAFGVVSDFPLHLDIEVTGRCNLMCIQCFRHSRRTNVGDMDMELFRRIIDEGIAHGLPSINPSWLGESFMHPRLVDMIRYAHDKGVMDIIINTNGVLVDGATADRILDAGATVIVFSVDAVTEKTYNRVKFGSDFALVNKNIEHLVALRDKKGLHKPRVIVQMIDMKQTHEELSAFIDYWRVRVNRVRVATYQSPDGKPHDKNRVQHKPDSIFPCPQLWQRLVIAWDGTAYPCIGDNACRMPLGNIKDKSLHDIWHGETLTRLREMHRNYEADNIEMCLRCDLNKIPKSAKNYKGGKSEKS